MIPNTTTLTVYGWVATHEGHQRRYILVDLAELGRLTAGQIAVRLADPGSSHPAIGYTEQAIESAEASSTRPYYACFALACGRDTGASDRLWCDRHRYGQ